MCKRKMMATLRRNGLLSSCEPCRKSKLRCDHATPVCNRCHRRGKPEVCVYHPAPMTRCRDPGQSRSAELAAGSQGSSLDVGQISPGTPWNRSSPQDAGQSQDQRGSLRDKYITDWSKRTASFSTPGFLGLTSYSAVFSESENSLGVSKQPNITVGLRDLSSSFNRNIRTTDGKQMQLGSELLLLLFDDFALYEKIAVAGAEICEGHIFGKPLIRMIFQSVGELYHRWVNGSADKRSGMLSLSKKIFEECSTTIILHPAMSPREYFASISARWETIGIIFSMIGLGSCLTSDVLFKQEGLSAIDHRGVGILATAAGERCMHFCDNAGVISEPLSWLLLIHTHLLSLVYGDSDYRAWKKLGEVTTLVFALGFHQSEHDAKTPFFLVEQRKRLMSSIFIIDKELATFLGRPPRISWRYCDMQLPLDLSYDEILAEPEVRDAAIRKLDMNGWNTEGSFAKAARRRVSFYLGYIRELVLELSINHRDGDLSQRAKDISHLSRKIRDDLPSFLQWKEGAETSDVSELPSPLPFYIHLDLLYNDFLLQRILVKRLGSGSEVLVNLSHEILRTLLMVVARRIRVATDMYALGWSIPYFGLPTAGVLAVEVLRQSQCQQEHRQTSFPRSEVIQNLSIFASQIQYVILPQQGNYEICQQARKVIRHILDRVLSSPTDSSTSVTPSNFLPADWLNDDGMWLNDGTDFMRWIDGLDWGQESG